MPPFRQRLAVFRRVPGSVWGCLLFGALYGLREAFLQAQQEAAFAWWGLGLAFALCLCAKADLRATLPPSFAQKLFSWGLLFVALVLMIFGFSPWAYWAVGVSAVVFFGGLACFWSAAGAFGVWAVVLPSMAYLHFAISFPMRVIAAQLSTGILRLFGLWVQASDTTVLIDGKVIAITAACSGIEQLEALLLFAFVAAFFMQKHWRWRWLHMLVIFPLILFVNALRLCVTLVGSHYVGDVFLSERMHSALGLVSVVAICAIYLWIGGHFPDRKEVSA